MSPSAPGGAERAKVDRSSRETPSIVAAAWRTRAALSVHTKGKEATGAVGESVPATAPVESAAGVVATLNTVPEVPMETMTSPSTAPTPSAAAALSPRPGPSWYAGGGDTGSRSGIDDPRNNGIESKRPTE